MEITRISTLQRLKIIPIATFFLDFSSVLWGMASHALLGKNSPNSYQALIRLFCRTQGKSNDLFSKMISLVHPEPTRKEVSGVLGTLDETRLNKILGDLEQKGYHVFENFLDEKTCDELHRISVARPANVRGKDVMSIYDPAKPQGVRYDIDTRHVVNEAIPQSLMIDESVVALSQAYLKTTPILDIVDMWWHTAYQKEPDSDAAQFFHFDMDRIKWLKFFFYITDVTTDTGPHRFIEGTHRTGGIPKKLLHKGYARILDSELEQYYDRSKFIEFTGKRGTIIAEDTRGFHKGKPVHQGDRLVFQLQFSNSLFGGHHHTRLKIQQTHSPRMKDLVARRSRLLRNLL